MILEAISALLTAVSIVFSRLDRHQDTAMATRTSAQASSS